MSKSFLENDFETRDYFYIRILKISSGIYRLHGGADLALVIRGGPNSEHFLSNLRKLLKKGKLFLTTPSLIVKRN